jgi:cardiolipin synthase
MTVLTAANQLTLLRLLLVPVFALMMLYGFFGWALLTFFFAGLTDAFDGLIARRTGQQTTLGAWLDPMADKLLLATMFIILTVPGLGLHVRLPLWLTVLVISRDVGIILTVAVVNLAVAPRTFKPTMLGKTATVVFVVTGVIALYANYLGRPMVLLDAAIYVAGIVTVVSAIEYVVRITRGLATDR